MSEGVGDFNFPLALRTALYFPALSFLLGCAFPHAPLLCDPSLTGTLPDGHTVYATIIVPEETVTKGEAWQAWEAAGPRKYSCCR